MKDNMARWLRELLEKQGITKKDINRFLVFLCAAIAFIFLEKMFSPYLNEIAFWLMAISMTMVVIFTWGLAGRTFFRSCIAAGAGLSVLSFIAMSYCAVSPQFRNADDALKSILTIGVAYVIYVFTRSLYKEFFGDKNAKDKPRKEGVIAFFKEKDGKIAFIPLFFYILFLFSFVYQLYRVMHSIFSNLCIFK